MMGASKVHHEFNCIVPIWNIDREQLSKMASLPNRKQASGRRYAALERMSFPIVPERVAAHLWTTGELPSLIIVMRAEVFGSVHRCHSLTTGM